MPMAKTAGLKFFVSPCCGGQIDDIRRTSDNILYDFGPFWGCKASLVNKQIAGFYVCSSHKDI